MRALRLFFCFALFTACKRAPEPPPAVPASAIVRPMFELKDGSLSAGTAFFVRLPQMSAPLGLTALHLFGPAGGLERAVPPGELGQRVRRVSFFDEGATEPHAAGPMVALPGTSHEAPEGDYSRDLAAFLAPPSESGRALPLADRNAKVGQDVWLVAVVLGDGAPAGHLHRARVVVSKPAMLAYTFAEKALELRATSGAPVVNARGEVVGVNLGGGHNADGVYGLAHPVESVRAHLGGAAGR